MASRVVLRRLLTGFCILTAFAWTASLVFICVGLALASRRLGNLGPATAGLAFIAIEFGGALVGRWRIRRSADILDSGWTPVAVVVALCLVILNVYTGLGVG